MESPSQARKAERLVEYQLALQGWRILARNFRTVGTELDLVAQKGRTVAIIEVKQRAFVPRTAADLTQLLPYGKKQALQRGARAFLSRHPVDCDVVRFDLALVIREHKKEAGPGPASFRYYVNVLA